MGELPLKSHNRPATKPFVTQLLYRARDLRSAKLYEALSRWCRGNVLDVGGWDFIVTASRRGVPYTSWTTLEYDRDCIVRVDDRRFHMVLGDGCRMPFGEDRFDTVLCVQVLEHVFEPLKMVQEIARVLKPGGWAILMLPQTVNLHRTPYHYQNFTRYWVLAAMDRVHLEIVQLLPLGGSWSTMASRLVFFLLQSAGRRTATYPEAKRNPAFYLLLPVMWLFAVVCIPICLLLSLGDLVEEPNNHLCVARKTQR